MGLNLLRGYALVRAGSENEAYYALVQDAGSAGFHVLFYLVSQLPDGLTDAEMDQIAKEYLNSSYLVLILAPYGNAEHSYVIEFTVAP